MDGLRIKPQPTGVVLAVDSATGNLAPGMVETDRSGRVAVIRARGFLGSDPDLFEFPRSFGGDVANLEDLNAAVRAADADPEVDVTFLDLGGRGTGAERMPETMATIRDAKNETVAWIGTTAYSGFGFMAQAADRVLGSTSAAVGSLSTIIGFQPADPESTVEFFSPSRLKEEMNAGKLTSRVREELQQSVEALDQVLRDAVMLTRGGKIKSPETVFSGQSFVGQAAVDVGLIDELHPTMADALASVLNTEDEDMRNTTSAVPAGPATTEAAPAEATAPATATAAAEPDDAHVGRWFRQLFSRAETPAPAPAAEPAADPQVAALEARLAQLEERAATAEANEIRARVQACRALPADAVDPIANLAAACSDPEARAAALESLAAINPPARLDATAFADLPVAGRAGSLRLASLPPGADPAEFGRVEEISAQHAADPAAEMAALERAFAEGGR